MSFFESLSIRNILGSLINPATEEKQDSAIAAIVEAASTLPTGASTEAKQDDIITAIEVTEPFPTDTITGAVLCIDYAHHERHSGRNFTYTYYGQSVASIIVCFKVRDDLTREPHFTFQWKCEDAGQVHFYKGSTWTASTGTSVQPNNSYDSYHDVNNSVMQSNASGTYVSNRLILNPTGISHTSARLLFQEPVWSTNQAPAEAGIGARHEQILEVGETYAIIVTPDTTGNAWLHLDWYEHTPETA